MITSLLIANRGEIACRIIRTCQRLGVKTTAVYSDADQNALHVKSADQAVHIGGSRPGDSYLLGDRIIAAAKLCGAQAIHPGFGFLSENADFADAVEQAGLIFVGPRSASMRKMGSKAGAKTLMQAANVPVVPGYEGAEQDLPTLRLHAEKIGFPLMIKAAHGGGGKGMRIVHALSDFDAALESCQREAKNAFGRDRVLLERYIETPRHIEIQIFGDQSGQVLHLNERECSVQRRYQKIIEESPSPLLTPELRAQMGAAAVKAGAAIDYLGAGTVEFIMGPDRQFYFMEINTRLQVEHPVTEACLGLDLVEWQLRVASGQRMPWLQNELIGKGHAIEVRIYAEDPENQFLPASGTLSRLSFPSASHARIDSGVAQGDLVSVFYDPMIAKLIVHAPDRAQAVAKLSDALQSTCIGGIKSNVDFLEVLIRHPDFIQAKIDTGYLDRKLADIYVPAHDLPAGALAAACVWALQQLEQQSQNRANLSSDPHSPWAQSDGFRTANQGKRAIAFDYRGERIDVSAHGHADRYQLDFALQGNLQSLKITDALTAACGERLNLKIDAHAYIFDVRELQLHSKPGGQLEVHDGTRRYLLTRKAAFEPAIQTEVASDRIKAPMPGRIVAVKVAIDQDISLGQELLVMEAMKMELSLKAPMAGRIAELRVAVGDFVEADAVLLRLS